MILLEEERLEPFFLVSDSVIVPNITSMNAYMSGLYPEQTSSSFSPFYLNPTFMHVEPCPIITTQQFTHHLTNSSSMETELHQVEKGEIKGKLKHAKQKRKKKVKAEKKEKPQSHAAPTDYVHVRARRGQATDSHSLAERARREKISQRMKFLQSLVPGCDKINGKALILDEIIDYIQSLQNQVEFLAAKLSSVYPIFSDFKIELESNKLTTENHYTSMDPDLTYLIQSDSFQLGSIVDTMPTSNISLSFQNGEGYSPAVLPISKDDEDLLWDVENQKTMLASLYGLNHSGSNQIYHLPSLY